MNNTSKDNYIAQLEAEIRMFRGTKGKGFSIGTEVLSILEVRRHDGNDRRPVRITSTVK